MMILIYPPVITSNILDDTPLCGM